MHRQTKQNWEQMAQRGGDRQKQWDTHTLGEIWRRESIKGRPQKDTTNKCETVRWNQLELKASRTEPEAEEQKGSDRNVKPPLPSYWQDDRLNSTDLKVAGLWISSLFVLLLLCVLVTIFVTLEVKQLLQDTLVKGFWWNWSIYLIFFLLALICSSSHLLSLSLCPLSHSPQCQQYRESTSVLENQPAGTFVLQVSAVDADEGSNGRVTYGFMHKDSTVPAFSIHPETGTDILSAHVCWHRHALTENAVAVPVRVLVCRIRCYQSAL